MYVNNYGGGAIGAPSTGFKRSGFDRGGGHEAVLEFTRVKSVIINATA